MFRTKDSHADAISALRDVRLTLGLMGLDDLHLRVLSTSSEDETERKNAAQGALQTPGALLSGLLTQICDILSPPSFETPKQGPSLGTCGELSILSVCFYFTDERT